MNKMLFFVSILIVSSFFSVVSATHAAKPSDFGLKEGDLVSAIFSDDPDVYIVNEQGYKRLFLNPEIFKFYTHLGGFANVKLITPEIRDTFPTSGLFRDCENNDPKVYGIEVSGEDKGTLRWINESGDQVVKDDPDFFKKVFCINTKEFEWYPKSQELTSIKEVPQYSRLTVSTIPVTSTVPASSSHPLVPSTAPKPASASFSPTPTPVTQPATPASPATSTQTVSPTASTSYTPPPTPTLTPTPTPSTSTFGPKITSLSVSPTDALARQLITFTATAEDPNGVVRIIYDIRYPDSSQYDAPFYLRQGCNFNSVTSGTCTTTLSIDSNAEPQVYGRYAIESVRIVNTLWNVSTYYPDGTVLNRPESTHSLNIPAVTINETLSFKSITRDLYSGMTGNDVKQLQALLVNEVGYSADLITGYFGSITRDAVKKLQNKYSISPVSGYFGEITRKTLKALMSNR